MTTTMVGGEATSLSKGVGEDTRGEGGRGTTMAGGEVSFLTFSVVVVVGGSWDPTINMRPFE